MMAGAAIAAGMALVAMAPAGAQGDAAQAAFATHCAACHQEDGKGVEGAFPALAGNPFLQGPAQQAVAVVLDGRNGMPSFRADLDDRQIATVLSYARSAWGNKAGPITVEQVAAERARAR